MDRFNDRWEEDMKRAVPKSTDYVKAKLATELELYRVGNSVIKDSVNKIENAGTDNQNNAFSNDKRLVRTMEPNMSGNNNSFNNNSFDTSNIYDSNPLSGFGGVSTDEASGKNFYGSGYSTALILSFTAALVFLVFLVCLLFANYF